MLPVQRETGYRRMINGQPAGAGTRGPGVRNTPRQIYILHYWHSAKCGLDVGSRDNHNIVSEYEYHRSRIVTR